jgi:hypothetical protein
MAAHDEALARRRVCAASVECSAGHEELQELLVSGDTGAAKLAARRLWDAQVYLIYQEAILIAVQARSGRRQSTTSSGLSA